MLLWIGSIVTTLAALGLGIGSLTGSDRILLLAAGALYLGGVQLPTITVHLPLNRRVQALDVDALDAPTLRAARAGFEARWIRWNRPPDNARDRVGRADADVAGAPVGGSSILR